MYILWSCQSFSWTIKINHWEVSTIIKSISTIAKCIYGPLKVVLCTYPFLWVVVGLCSLDPSKYCLIFVSYSQQFSLPQWTIKANNDVMQIVCLSLPWLNFTHHYLPYLFTL